MDSSVYVNGQLAGEWKYGYSSFEHDITKAVIPGINEIVVKVVHQSPNSRWYSGAGIYRNVWLNKSITSGAGILWAVRIALTPISMRISNLRFMAVFLNATPRAPKS